MNLSDIKLGQRVLVDAYVASQLPTRYGTVSRIDPHHTGQCSVTVTMDDGHERLGAVWAFAPSSLKPALDGAEMARRCSAHDAALDAGKPSPISDADMEQADEWLRTACDADIDRAMDEAKRRAAAAPVTHYYLTDGHEGAGWNTTGATHAVTIMVQGASDQMTPYMSRAVAMSAIAAAKESHAETGTPYKVHDLTRRGEALRRYRDSRAIHVRSLKRWKAELRATDGNPMSVVLAHMPPQEIRRDAMLQAVQMARHALANTRARLASL
jgi:hypothetical protein